MQIPSARLATEVGGAVQLQAVDPATVFDLAGPVRASAMFVFVLLVGSVLLWRHKGFVEYSTTATLSDPLRTIGYGIATHAVLVFAALYLGSQLALVDVAGVNFGTVGLLLGGVLLGVTGSVGFTVVGIAIVDVWGEAAGWSGVALGALLAGGVAGLEPLVAGVVWVGLVSFGIGGAVRDWLRASARADI
ncbi:MAG: hypothetical protein V5A38_03745 [Halolamina sp.]|uniref:hypothetical protein n=1 Tax=Halolamina sp. TaxID=1940283 RepID=UPI002FC2E0B8